MEAVAAAGTESSAGSGGYALLRRMVHDRTGFNMESYKDRFIERRVAIRVRATHHEGLGEYLKYLAREQPTLQKRGCRVAPGPKSWGNTSRRMASKVLGLRKNELTLMVRQRSRRSISVRSLARYAR